MSYIATYIDQVRVRQSLERLAEWADQREVKIDYRGKGKFRVRNSERVQELNAVDLADLIARKTVAQWPTY
jgi:hypothetical protein